MVLNRNPKNYFAEIEQSAFNPASMVPGVEPSPDKMLQVKMQFKYMYQQHYVIVYRQVCTVHTYMFLFVDYMQQPTCTCTCMHACTVRFLDLLYMYVTLYTPQHSLLNIKFNASCW